MPPLPKRRTSHARQGERRQHLGIKTPVLVPCPQCREPRLQHRACPNCGSYKGRTVLDNAPNAPKPQF